MTMSQNLCLICCYSFQEKRSRFISDESRDSFKKFCVELNLGSPLPGNGGNLRSERSSSSNLDLPYGENITVCGDCLSLIVLYVQRRSVQVGREKKVLELQKAVCAALKDLQEIVEDVQGHIDQLHSTIRMGDESCLNSYFNNVGSGPGEEEKENNPKAFREKILRLNSGRNQNLARMRFPSDEVIPLNIKVEPGEVDEMDLNFNPGPFPSEEYGNAYFSANDDNDREDEPDFSEAHQPQEILSTSSGVVGVAKVSTSRRGRSRCRLTRAGRQLKRRFQYRDDFPQSPLEEEANSDFEYGDGDDIHEHDQPSDDDDEEKEHELNDFHSKWRGRKLKRKRSAKKGLRKVRFPKKMKTESANIGTNLKELEQVSLQAAAQWKDDLIGRIVMEMNNDINKLPASSQQEIDSSNVVDEAFDNLSTVGCDSFQLIDGQLKLCGVVVKIRERNRALQCTRCGKKYFEKRDVTGEHTQLESLMRDHILSKHLVKRTKNPFQEMEVVSYTSTTRSKITSKLACSLRYSYTRRATNSKSGAQYFRCDYRLENCGATILYHNGVYRKMTRGWNSDGTHTIHAPDVERTNRQIEVGRAKDLFLQNSTKSIDDVCDDILNQSNGQLITPLERLKRRLLYAKYKTTGMPLEERNKRSFKCPQCDQVYKEKRGLTRHMKTRHEPHSFTETTSSPLTSSTSTTTKCPPLKKPKKPPSSKSSKTEMKPNFPEEPPAAPIEGPSIVFNDPSVASNFVNKCITAIIQQVGLSVSGNVNSSSAQVRPSALAPTSTSTSTSPTPSEISQHENGGSGGGGGIPNPPLQSVHVPLQSRILSVSSSFGPHQSQNQNTPQSQSQWQQQQNTQGQGQQQQQLQLQGQFTSSVATTSTQMHPWPWNLP